MKERITHINSLPRSPLYLPWWIKWDLPVRLGFPGYTLLGIHTCQLVYTKFIRSMGFEFSWTATDILRIPLSYLSIILLYQIINLALQNRPRWRVCANLILLIAYTLGYALRRPIAPHFALIADDLREPLDDPSAATILFSAIGWKILPAMVSSITVVFLWSERKNGVIPPMSTMQRPVFLQLVVCTLLYASLIAIPAASYDQVTDFLYR